MLILILKKFIIIAMASMIIIFITMLLSEILTFSVRNSGYILSKKRARKSFFHLIIITDKIVSILEMSKFSLIPNLFIYLCFFIILVFIIIF